MFVDVVTGMLQVFSTSVHPLHNPRSMLSFVTPFLDLTFEILPEVLHDLILFSTHSEEKVRNDRVYKECVIVICGNTMCSYLVKLAVHDFYVILGTE